MMNGPIIFYNIREIYRRISHAAMRAGREPSEIRLVAVTKTIDAERIKMAIEAGLRIFGENRVQEAKGKIADITPGSTAERLHWHLIGHLQKNKAKDAVLLFDLIHSVDSAELAAALNLQAAKIDKVQRILVQVKLSEEESKHGVEESGLMDLLKAADEMKNLKLEGLMTIPPYFEDSNDARPYFRRLRELRDAAEREGFRLPELSMGMSHDFEAAIQEGATYVRVGTAIFGERA